MSSVGYGAGGRGIPLTVDEPYRLSANIENQRIHQRHTVLVTRITGYLEKRVGGGRGRGVEGNTYRLCSKYCINTVFMRMI